jgi:hypothetical protein
MTGQMVQCPSCGGQFRALPPQALATRGQTAIAFSPASIIEADPYLGTAVTRESRRQYIPDKKSAGAAAVASFLYIGLGQIYNGQIAKGFMLMFLPPFVVGVAFGVISAGIVSALSDSEPPERPHVRINGQRYNSDAIPPDLLERLNQNDRDAIEIELRNYYAALRKVHAAALSEQEAEAAAVLAVYVGAAIALVAAWLFGIYDAYSTAEQINERERRRYR